MNAPAQSVAHNSPVVSQVVWQHAFGQALIETCADGTVLIDGKVVHDTLPGGPGNRAPGHPADKAP